MEPKLDHKELVAAIKSDVMDTYHEQALVLDAERTALLALFVGKELDVEFHHDLGGADPT